MSPFEAYKTYLALKQHFEREGYDFFRYNGKVTAKIESFYARRDKYFFEKLARKKEDLVDFLVANFLERDHSWSRDMTSEEAEKTYSDWCRRVESLTYQFSEELSKIEDLKTAVNVKDGQHPQLLKMYMQKSISPETLLIIDSYSAILQYWDDKIQERVIWPGIYLKLKKYKPFLKFDRDKFRSIIVEKYVK